VDEYATLGRRELADRAQAGEVPRPGTGGGLHLDGDEVLAAPQQEVDLDATLRRRPVEDLVVQAAVRLGGV
jgi:hypothetical protein